MIIMTNIHIRLFIVFFIYLLLPFFYSKVTAKDQVLRPTKLFVSKKFQPSASKHILKHEVISTRTSPLKSNSLIYLIRENLLLSTLFFTLFAFSIYMVGKKCYLSIAARATDDSIKSLKGKVGGAGGKGKDEEGVGKKKEDDEEEDEDKEEEEEKDDEDDDKGKEDGDKRKEDDDQGKENNKKKLLPTSKETVSTLLVKLTGKYEETHKVAIILAKEKVELGEDKIPYATLIEILANVYSVTTFVSDYKIT